MIDWWGLAHNALWVVGLAVMLAAWSMAGYRAQKEGRPLRHELAGVAFQLPFDLGMTLLCLGLLFSGRTWWKQALWGLLAAANGIQAAWLGRRARAR